MTTCASIFAAVLSAWTSVQWHEWAKTLVDLLKGISWPLAIFGVIFTFRHQIRERFPDLISLGPAGAVLQPRQARGGRDGNPLETEPHPLPSVNAKADEIRRELETLVEEQRQPRLIRALAEAQLFGNFEFIFGVIFGSQISALRELLDGPKSEAEARDFFKHKVVPVNKELESWGFEKWASYLISEGLVTVEGKAISLSQKGRDFLVYVDRYKEGWVRSN